MFDVTFVSVSTGAVIAEFMRQSRQQVTQLVEHPPYATTLCSVEIRVKSC
jgi:hypothetical protein